MCNLYATRSGHFYLNISGILQKCGTNWNLLINVKRERERWEEKRNIPTHRCFFHVLRMEAEDFYASRYRSEPSRFVRSHEYKLPSRGGGVVERLAAAQRHAWIKKGRAEWSFLPMRNYDPVAAHAAKKKSIDRPIWGDYYETVYHAE